MARASRYPQDVRDRAVRLVLDHRGQYASEWQAITSIAPKVGAHPDQFAGSTCSGSGGPAGGARR
jgi:transposase-like protein